MNLTVSGDRWLTKKPWDLLSIFRDDFLAINVYLVKNYSIHLSFQFKKNYLVLNLYTQLFF